MSPRTRETFNAWRDRLLWAIMLAWGAWITAGVVMAKTDSASLQSTLASIDKRLQRIEDKLFK